MTTYEIVAIEGNVAREIYIVTVDGEGCVRDANGQDLFWFRREDAQRAIDGMVADNEEWRWRRICQDLTVEPEPEPKRRRLWFKREAKT